MLIYDPSRFHNLQSFADAALTEYKSNSSFLNEAGARFHALLSILLRESAVRYHSLAWRSKDDASFHSKAARPNPSNPMRPKYECPSEQIEDQLGFRIVTYLKSDVREISSLIESQFTVISTEDKGTNLLATKRFGYQSVHHVAKLRPDRASMLENARFANVRFELQIRTVLQDAWAEIEHNIGYKPHYEKLDISLERRFLTVAGVLEMVDAEFERIKDEATNRRAQVHENFQNQTAEVDVTPSSLQLLISARLGTGELDRDVLATTAELVKALDYPSIASLNGLINRYKDSKQFRQLAIDYSDPVMRFYGMLAFDKGSAQLRALVTNPSDQSSSWDSFFRSVESAESSP